MRFGNQLYEFAFGAMQDTQNKRLFIRKNRKDKAALPGFSLHGGIRVPDSFCMAGYNVIYFQYMLL